MLRVLNGSLTMLCCPLLLQYAKDELSTLEMDLTELEELRVELAAYFCEDDTTFKLEESIKIFHIFCDKFKKAIQVNV